MSPILKGLGLPTAALLVALCQAPAARACDGEVRTAADKAVESWEANSGIAVARAVRSVVVDEFCLTAQELIREKRAEASAIAAVAGKVVDEHLGREVASGRQTRSMAAVLRSEFKAAGFSRPQVKRRVVVTMKYTQHVNALSAAGDLYPKAKALLLPVGEVQLEALFKTKAVCSKTLELQAGVDAEFSC